MALIQVANKPFVQKNNFVILDAQNCPQEGAYSVVVTSDGDNPISVIISGEDAIFFDNGGIYGIYLVQDLDYSYMLEPCDCSVMFI